MGEYADMEIFAQMRGKTTSDLGRRELTEFYAEHDDRPSPSGTRCPICRKRVKGEVGLRAHMRDKHS